MMILLPSYLITPDADLHSLLNYYTKVNHSIWKAALKTMRSFGMPSGA